MLHKILTSLHVKIHAGDDCNLFGCREQKYPTQNIFSTFCPVSPLTCAKNQYTIIVVLVWLSW